MCMKNSNHALCYYFYCTTYIGSRLIITLEVTRQEVLVTNSPIKLTCYFITINILSHRYKELLYGSHRDQSYRACTI